MRTGHIIPFLLLSTLLAPVASYATDSYQDRSAPRIFIKDSPITARIRARLDAEDLPGLEHVKVATDRKGFVQLKGSVRTQSQADRAAGIARRVDGVTFVENDIHVDRHHAKVSPPLSGKERMEARIKAMHDKLKITPEQEIEWAQVADIMRVNEMQMEVLVKARTEKPNMTAVENLSSYAEITNEHADGIERLTPVFTALYDQMTPEQKKIADEYFNRKGDRERKA